MCSNKLETWTFREGSTCRTSGLQICERNRKITTRSKARKRFLSHTQARKHTDKLRQTNKVITDSLACENSRPSLLPSGHSGREGRLFSQDGRRTAVYATDQGGKRPGGETGSPLLGQCVMRRRTGTSAPSALPVQLMAAKNLLSTNRKWHFLSLFLSYQ